MQLGPNTSTPVRQQMLAGLIGQGISLSRTPAMHMAEAATQGIQGLYRLLDTDTPRLQGKPLAEILNAAELAGFDGLNITYPYKIEVIGLLDQLSPNAEAVGAVNTVVFRDGKRFGHNTDMWGFAQSFRLGLLPEAKLDNVLLLGAGGAGVAVAFALIECGVRHLSIFDADHSRAQGLADQITRRFPDSQVTAITDIARHVAASRPDGVVNATPVGMAKLPGSAFPLELLDARMWVADVVYFPLETALLAAARAKGCRVLPGSGMAVFQAVRAFELFTGRKADPTRMKATFDAFDAKPVQRTKF